MREGQGVRASGVPGFRGLGFRVYLPLVSREWKNGSYSSYNCTPFLHSLLTKGEFRVSDPSLSLGFRGSLSFLVGCRAFGAS